MLPSSLAYRLPFERQDRITGLCVAGIQEALGSGVGGDWVGMSQDGNVSADCQ
jgi:hypothetical protein